MIITCVQIDVAWHDQRANLASARRLLAGPALPNADLVVLPEMFSTGFSMDVSATAEGEAKPAETFLAETAVGRRCHALGGVVRLAPDGRGLNQAVLFAPDGAEKLRYTKMHPFAPAGEAEHYAPGDAPAVTDLPTRDKPVKIAAFICYDLRFPEGFRAAALAGAEVLAVIANWPACRAEHWQALLTARAIENQACVVGVNRVGSDPNEDYAGGSMVVDARGRVVARAGDGEGVLSADLDIAALRRYRREFPALSDARPGWVRPLR